MMKAIALIKQNANFIIMKALAAILAVYWLALFVQPVLLPLQKKEVKKMSCCAKKQVNKEAHKGCNEKSKKGGRSGKDICNPLFNQCPVCSPAFVLQANIAAHLHLYRAEKQQYANHQEHFISQYCSGLLRPPQAV